MKKINKNDMSLIYGGKNIDLMSKINQAEYFTKESLDSSINNAIKLIEYNGNSSGIEIANKKISDFENFGNIQSKFSDIEIENILFEKLYSGDFDESQELTGYDTESLGFEYSGITDEFCGVYELIKDKEGKTTKGKMLLSFKNRDEAVDFLKKTFKNEVKSSNINSLNNSIETEVEREESLKNTFVGFFVFTVLTSTVSGIVKGVPAFKKYGEKLEGLNVKTCKEKAALGTINIFNKNQFLITSSLFSIMLLGIIIKATNDKNKWDGYVN